MGARGHGIVIAQKMSIVLGQVVEDQRSVQRTVRRDRTTSFLFVLADFSGIRLYQHCIMYVSARVTLILILT